MSSIKNRKSKIIIEYLKKFNLLISKMINTILLTIVYFVGIGITSIAGKIFRKRFLDMDLKGGESFWIEVEEKAKTREDYKRMF